MLYVVVAFMGAVLLFLLLSYFLSLKRYTFPIDENLLMVENKAAHLRIYINGILCEDYYMPKLIKGEEFLVKVADKDVLLKIRSSSLGYKMSVRVFIDGEFFMDNGVVFKRRTPFDDDDDLTDDDNLTNNDEKDIKVNINRNVEWN